MCAFSGDVSASEPSSGSSLVSSAEGASGDGLAVPLVRAGDAERVAAYLRARREDYVETVSELALIETPSTDPETIAPALDRVERALVSVGYATLRLPGENTGGCLYARPEGRKRGRPCQLLVGHIDTVWPQGTLARMPVAKGDGRLRGPGVFDMKSGVTSFLFALRALHDLGLTPEVDPVVLITSDEEIGSHESRRYIERLAKAADRAYVTEPALGLQGHIKTARKGTGEYEFVVRASAASSNGQSGAGDESDVEQNAAVQGGASRVVGEMASLVQRLHALGDPDRGVTVNVGTVDSRLSGGEGRLGVDVRVPTREAAVEVDGSIRALEASTSGVELEVCGGIERPPLERTPGNRVLWEAAQRLGSEIGLDLTEGRSGGASDGNFTSLHAPTLDGLGAVGDGAHATHEYIEVEETVDRCALLTLLLLLPPVSEAGAVLEE